MLWKKIRELYADSNEPKDQIIKLLTWNYPQEHMVEHIMREVNGYDLSTGKLLNGIGEIKDEGTTNSGMWIYAGVMREGGVHMAKRRGQDDPGNMGIYPGYGWVWLDNIHLLYNRASCDENGNPINPDKKIIWWDVAAKMWKGYDRPDVGSLTAAPNTPAGQKPFRMVGEGVGRIFAASYKDVEDGETRDSSSTPVDGQYLSFMSQSSRRRTPTCMLGCPEGAISKKDSGAVVIDKSKCVGCGYCRTNCPFNVPRIDPERNKSTKCDLYFDRIEHGMIPSCAKTCTAEAISFGTKVDMIKLAEERLKEVRMSHPNAQIYGVHPNGVGGIHMMYVLPEPPEVYGLPKDQKTPDSIDLWRVKWS